jgi:hypothetical protein
MPVADQIPLGAVYGRLTIIHELPRQNTKRVLHCQCACGNTVETLWQNLKRGATTSCGCYAKEINTTHGGSRTPIHTTWFNMVARCSKPNRKDYPYYGGKGIKVYEPWLDFMTFKEWALGSGWAEGLTVERRDVDQDYCPGNCYWADSYTQAANRSKRVTSNAPYLGVSKWGNRWASFVCVNYVNTRVGAYDTPEEARDARNDYIVANKLPHTLS